MRNLKMIKLMHKAKDPTTTSWAVSGLGLLVSTVGAKLITKKFGAGILGFGLAHIVLGQLDRLRPSVKKHSFF